MFFETEINTKTVAESESNTRARLGKIHMPHGLVETPLFMPVATRGSVRAQDLGTVDQAGAQILLTNTYHLMKTPGLDLLKKFGGIHRFTNWKKGFLTDSGGYQVFSLRHRMKLEEEGVTLEGRKLTPESVSEAQFVIGSDIHMVLDQCVPSQSDRPLVEEALHRTHRWAQRARIAHLNNCERFQMMKKQFGIIQGACDPELRRLSAEQINSIDWDGIAVGGLAVGESRAQREESLDAVAPYLPPKKPRYLMGVGTPIDLLEAIHRGLDLFDCILPTAFAQQGLAFSLKGKVHLRRGVYSDKEIPIDETCECPTCLRYSRAYLHHLIKNKEVLGWQLIGTHNLFFYFRFLKQIKSSIQCGDFYRFYLENREIIAGDDVHFPVERPKRGQTQRQHLV